MFRYFCRRIVPVLIILCSAAVSLAQSVVDLGFSVIGKCEHNASRFFPEAEDETPPDRYFWDFGDGNTSTYIAPAHQYAMPGTYEVSLAAITGEDTTFFQKTVEIRPNYDSLDLGADTVIRSDWTLSLQLGEMGFNNITSVKWSTGHTGFSIEVNEQGYFWAKVELANGCTVHDGISVGVRGVGNQEANHWYFGGQAGLSFEEGKATAASDGLMTAPEGVAAISDEGGELLFYTDGNNLWGVDDATGDHVLVETGLGGGNEATQSSLFIPFPGDKTLFYLFTTEEGPGDPGSDNTYNVNYSVIDIKENHQIGEAVVKNMPLFAPGTERLTAVELENKVVLLAHELGNNVFRAYPIDGGGIGAPVYSSVGAVHPADVAQSGGGYMKFSPDGSKAAVAIPGIPEAKNTVEIFSFDKNTLQLSDPLTLVFDEPGYEAYGVGFSPAGNKLFATFRGKTDSKLYELDLNHPDAASMLAGANITTVGAELGAIQIAPDGRLYVAVNGGGFLGRIHAGEDAGVASELDLEGLGLTGGTSALGLPNFMQPVYRPEKLPVTLSLDAEKHGADISLYPNPVGQTLNVEMKNGSFSIHLYSLSGKRLFSAESRNRKFSMDMSAFEAGVYILKVISGGETEGKMLIKR